MQTSKPVEFHGTAGGFFVLTIISLVCAYIPIFGWAFILNYSAGWVTDNALVNGSKVKYQADYMESLKFVFINTLLLIITLGIYSFWFYPKAYRYVADHVNYVEQVGGFAAPVAPVAPPVVAAPVVTPQAPTIG